MSLSISTLSVILSLMNFFVAQTSKLFFSKVEKLNISAIYKEIVIIFSVKSAFCSNLQVLLEKEIQIQPPQENLLNNIYVRVRQRTSKFKSNMDIFRFFNCRQIGIQITNRYGVASVLAKNGVQGSPIQTI